MSLVNKVLIGPYITARPCRYKAKRAHKWANKAPDFFGLDLSPDLLRILLFSIATYRLFRVLAAMD
jgi:hypothetical protein